MSTAQLPEISAVSDPNWDELVCHSNHTRPATPGMYGSKFLRNNNSFIDLAWLLI
jgi:hypothetical protein